MTQCVFSSDFPIPSDCSSALRRIEWLPSSLCLPSPYKTCRICPVSVLCFFLPFGRFSLRRSSSAACQTRRVYFFLFLFAIFSQHRALRGKTLTGATALPPGAEASEEAVDTDLPFLFGTRLPRSPTLYQEEQPLPFLREKTLFLIANEPVLDSHVASNLLHQLLYALQIPNDRVWLLDEILLQGPQNEKYATLLPWLVYTYYNLPPGVQYIWMGTAYSRVVGPALEQLLQKLHAAETSQQQTKKKKISETKEKQGHQEEEDEGSQQDAEVPPEHGLCIGFGLKDLTPSSRHHYYSDPDFIYPFLSAGLLVDTHFLRFLVSSVRDAGLDPQQRQQHEGNAAQKKKKRKEKTATLPARIEIDPIHELFKFLYDKHEFLMTHSDLFCPDNPMPRSLDRTETTYPALHQRQRRPSPARTLFDIRGRSNSNHADTETKKKKKKKRGAGDVAGEEKQEENVTSAELTALRKLETEIRGCVSFTVGSRHSPILSHQFFDRLMEFEEDKIARKEKLTQRFAIDSLLEPGSLYEKVEDEILNERPFFIVEPEDVFIAVKTHDANFERRLPLLKELWASEKALVATAKKRALQSQHILPFGDIRSVGNQEEELRALEDNMQQLRIVFFADSPNFSRKEKPEEKQKQELGRKKEEEKAVPGRGKLADAEQKSASETGELGEEEKRRERRGQQDTKKKGKNKEEEDESEENIAIREIMGDSLVRIPVPYPNEKRSLCEKMMGIMRHFYFKEKDRNFLVLVDDDTLMNVRHLLDLISLSLQPPIPARIFFRQALTDSNAIRRAHAPYQKLAADIDAFMLPWKRKHALFPPPEFPTAPTDGTSAAAAAASAADTASLNPEAGDGAAAAAAQHEEGERRSSSGDSSEKSRKGDTRRVKQAQKQLRDTRSASAKLIRSYVAAAYTQAWKGQSAAANSVSPLYVGERYSFRHTAARFLRSSRSSSSSSEGDTSRHRRDTCRSHADTTEREAAEKTTATGEGRGGESSVVGNGSSSSCSSSLLPSHPPFNPSSYSVVNELFFPGGYSYITGGGGIVLDRAAVRLVLECTGCTCPADGTADDMLLGLWLQHLLRVPSVNSSAFHQERPQEYHAAHLRQITPLSFHRLDRDADTTRREFQKYLDVGEGLNVGKFEEDDFQSIDWVDYDWQQVEDLLWHEADDNASDWLRHEEEEEDAQEGEEVREEIEEEETEAAEEGMRRREKTRGDGSQKEKDNVRERGQEKRAHKKKKKSKRSEIENVEGMNFSLPSVIEQILKDAAETEGMKTLSSEEVASRLEKRAAKIDGGRETGFKERYGGSKEQTRYTDEETHLYQRQEEL